MKDSDSKRLKEEYQKLVDGLRDVQQARDTDMVLANPILPDEILQGSFALTCITRYHLFPNVRPDTHSHWSAG